MLSASAASTPAPAPANTVWDVFRGNLLALAAGILLMSISAVFATAFFHYRRSQRTPFPLPLYGAVEVPEPQETTSSPSRFTWSAVKEHISALYRFIFRVNINAGHLDGLSDAVGNLHPFPEHIERLKSSPEDYQTITSVFWARVFSRRSIPTTQESMTTIDQRRRMSILITALGTVFSTMELHEILTYMAIEEKTTIGGNLDELVGESTCSTLAATFSLRLESNREPFELKCEEAQRDVKEGHSEHEGSQFFRRMSLQEVALLLILIGRMQKSSSTGDCLRLRNYSGAESLCTILHFVYPVRIHIGKTQEYIQEEKKRPILLAFEFDSSEESCITHWELGNPIKYIVETVEKESFDSGPSSSTGTPYSSSPSPFKAGDCDALATRRAKSSRAIRKALSYRRQSRRYRRLVLAGKVRERRAISEPITQGIEGMLALLRGRVGMDLWFRARRAFSIHEGLGESWDLDYLDSISLSTVRNFFRNISLGCDECDALRGLDAEFAVRNFFAIGGLMLAHVEPYMDVSWRNWILEYRRDFPCRQPEIPILDQWISDLVREAGNEFIRLPDPSLMFYSTNSKTHWWYLAFLEAVFGQHSDQLEVFADQMERADLLGSVEGMMKNVRFVVAAYGNSPQESHAPSLKPAVGLTSAVQNGAFALIPGFVLNENLGNRSQAPMTMHPGQIRLNGQLVQKLESYGGAGQRTSSKDLQIVRNLYRNPSKDPGIQYSYEHFYCNMAEQTLGWRYWTEEAGQIVDLDALMWGILKMRITAGFPTSSTKELWDVMSFVEFEETPPQWSADNLHGRWAIGCENIFQKRVAIAAAWSSGKRILHFEGRNLREGMACAEAIGCQVIICSAGAQLGYAKARRYFEGRLVC